MSLVQIELKEVTGFKVACERRCTTFKPAIEGDNGISCSNLNSSPQQLCPQLGEGNMVPKYEKGT